MRTNLGCTVPEIAAAFEREPKDVINKLHRLRIVVQPHRYYDTERAST